MRRFRSLARWSFFIIFICALLAGMIGAAGFDVQAAPPDAPQALNADHVVISEFRTRGLGGGNDEFIELYNPTSNAISIAGWVLRRSPACAVTQHPVIATIPVGVSISAGGHYLIGGASYSGAVTPDLPNQSLSIAIDGGIALFDNATDFDPSLSVDKVGMCDATWYVDVPSLAKMTSDVDQSYERKIGGSGGNCVDNGYNKSDFFLNSSSSNPQNSTSAPIACAPTPDQVYITEVAWGGTLASSADQWIELYNPGPNLINLDNWYLDATDGSLLVTLSGSIAPDTYFLLERREQATSVPSSMLFSGPIGFPVGNPTTLTLHDANGAIMDTANSDGGAWPAGQKVYPFGTMERLGPTIPPDGPFAWVTNDGSTKNGTDAAGNPIFGTPGAVNWGFSITLTPTYTPTATNTATATATATATPRTYLPLDVIINEVAWMGTTASSTDEWIELYNPGAQDIDLTGWKLFTSSGNLSVTLNGKILAGKYFLLERSDGNVTNVAQDQVYTGSMSNDGEILRLQAPSGAIIDIANTAGGNWPAGNSTNHASMERRGVIPDTNLGAWQTNSGAVKNGLDASGNPIIGTPRQKNWAFGITLTPTRTSTPSPTATRTPKIYPPLSVLINEVAWSGTDASDDDEWIELYNPGNTQIDFSANGGWKLQSTDGLVNITLTGKIAKDGYYLLERTADTTVSDITADQIYSGTLSNYGTILRLIGPGNVVVDTANVDGGSWPAGQSVYPFGTMERRGVTEDGPVAWITNTGVRKNGKDANQSDIYGTPKNKNWAYSVTPTASSTPTMTGTPTKTRTPYKSPTPYPTRTATARPGLIVLNEFLPRPGFDWNGDGVTDIYDEYIEIVNIGADTNLNGWKLDDEANKDSPTFALPNTVLKSGAKMVVYASQSGIRLSDAGDTVRLLMPNGQVMDAYTYGPVHAADETWCRMPDGRGQWKNPCFPTPGQTNSLTGAYPDEPPPLPWGEQAKSCNFPDTLPASFEDAECLFPGLDVFSKNYFGFSEDFPFMLPIDFKFPIFIY